MTNEHIRGAAPAPFQGLGSWEAPLSPDCAALHPGLPIRRPSRAAEDLEARLGIDQGRVSPPDYRIFLADLIDARFGSRQEFCRRTGRDPGQLSRVFARRADLSIKALQKVLECFAPTSSFKPTKKSANTPASPALKRHLRWRRADGGAVSLDSRPLFPPSSTPDPFPAPLFPLLRCGMSPVAPLKIHARPPNTARAAHKTGIDSAMEKPRAVPIDVAYGGVD